MNVLVLGLYAEGRTDERFLPLVIQLRMVEAWMLADPEALQRVLRTKASIQTLGLPAKAKQAEADKDPKETINQAIQKAYPNQPHRWNRIRGELYTDLAPVIRLDVLNQLTAYRQFV